MLNGQGFVCVTSLHVYDFFTQEKENTSASSKETELDSATRDGRGSRGVGRLECCGGRGAVRVRCACGAP